MEQRAGSHPFAQTPNQSHTSIPLGLTECFDIPLRAFRLIDANEGRLTAHRQAYIMLLKVFIDLVCDLLEPRPIVLAERLASPRSIIQTPNRYGIAEFHLGRFDSAADRCRLRGGWSAHERDVALARK